MCVDANTNMRVLLCYLEDVDTEMSALIFSHKQFPENTKDEVLKNKVLSGNSSGCRVEKDDSYRDHDHHLDCLNKNLICKEKLSQEA